MCKYACSTKEERVVLVGYTMIECDHVRTHVVVEKQHNGRHCGSPADSHGTVSCCSQDIHLFDFFHKSAWTSGCWWNNATLVQIHCAACVSSKLLIILNSSSAESFSSQRDDKCLVDVYSDFTMIEFDKNGGRAFFISCVHFQTTATDTYEACWAF